MIVGLVLGVALSSCGGGDASSPATAEGLEQAAREIVELTLDNPADLYDLLSADCKASLTRTQWDAQAAMAKVFIDALLEGGELTIGDVTTRNVTETSGEAAVQALFDGEDLGSSEEFTAYVYEDGAWRTTDCESVLGTSEGFDFDDVEAP